MLFSKVQQIENITPYRNTIEFSKIEKNIKKKTVNDTHAMAMQSMHYNWYVVDLFPNN